MVARLSCEKEIAPPRPKAPCGANFSLVDRAERSGALSGTSVLDILSRPSLCALGLRLGVGIRLQHVDGFAQG
jgi:hypothetical protein